MPFDPSTAAPLRQGFDPTTATPVTSFDPSTASPVQQTQEGLAYSPEGMSRTGELYVEPSERTAGTEPSGTLQGAGDIARGLPQMAAQIPWAAYEGLRMAAGGPEERTDVGLEAIRQALAQGQATAQDIQSPFGSREWIRGAAGLGMYAIPGLEIARELRAPIEPEIPPGPPPVQQPEISSTTRAQPQTTEIPKEDIPYAGTITSPTSVSQLEVRPPVGETAPLRQSGQAPDVSPPIQTQEVSQPAPVTGENQTESAIANRYTQARMQSGDLGEVLPSQGRSAEEAAANGQRLVNNGADVDAAVSRIMSGRYDPVADADVARFEEARLRNVKDRAYQQAQQNPGNIAAQQAYNNAFNDLTDFHKGPIAQLKANWHAGGMGLQGNFPVDLSTADGLREAWLQDTGTDMPEKIKPAAETMASRVRNAAAKDTVVSSQLDQQINNEWARNGRLSADAIRDRYSRELENRPCQ